MKKFWQKLWVNKKYLILSLISAGLIAVLLLFYFYPASSRKLELDFLDVGQGDAILIKTPNQQKILIDGGPDNSVLKQLAKNLNYFDKKIDLIILTHPHNDHLAGLIQVIAKFSVTKIIVPDINYQAANYDYFLSLIKAKGVNLIKINSPQIINFGENCELKIIHPFSKAELIKPKNLNDTSIVSQLDCQQKKVLLMGDAEIDVAEKLVNFKIDLQSDILKVGHHGSAKSVSEFFLKKIDPKVAIISVGRNNTYGHPDPKTMNLLNALGIKSLRTDQVGSIKILAPK